MSRVELETVDAPGAFGATVLVPAADELGAVADRVEEMMITAGVFGDDESGTALVDEYARVQTGVAARISADEEALRSAADALARISAGYRAMVEANTAQAR